MIVSGELLPGTRLPSMQEMANQWNTSYFTVQSALTPLVKEGLLERRRKSGTVVRGGVASLSCAAIYYGADIWATGEMSYYRELHHSLEALLATERIANKLWIDSRPSAEQGLPLPELRKAIEKREVQCVIAPLANGAEAQWLNRFPVPIAYAGTMEVPHRVAVAHAEGIRLALGRLREQGVRKVGLVHAIPRVPTRVSKGFPASVEFYHHFVEILKEMGMRMEDGWCHVPNAELKLAEMEEFGYWAFQKLWAMPPQERPEGVICASDIAGRGVVTAILQNSVHVPEEIKLVFYKNKEVGLFCPFPIDWIVHSASKSARALFTQIKTQLAGQPVQPIFVVPDLERGKFPEPSANAVAASKGM